MAGSTPPPAAAAYEEWILETIDSLRSRKARPDLERICRMVRRRHGPEPERTRQELERMVQRRAVLRVSYKGSISYRNAARLQPPRRSRGGGGGKAGNPAAAGVEQEGVQSGHEGGSPRRAVQEGESPRRGAPEERSPRPGAHEEGSSKHGLGEGGSLKDVKRCCNPLDGNCGVHHTGNKNEGALCDNPKEANLGVQGFGIASDAMFGLQGFGSPKDNMPGEESPKRVHSGRPELGCSKEVDPRNGKLVGPGDWSLADRKLWLQGGQSPKECQQEAISVLGEWSPKDIKFGALGAWNHRDGKSGVQGCCNIKDGKFGVLAGRSPKELMPGMHRPLSPMDCNLGIQVSGTLKEVIPGLQADGSPQNGKLGVQEWGNSKNGKCGVHSDMKAKDWKHGLQVGGTPKDGKPTVLEKYSSREILSVSQGGRNLKDGKPIAPGGGRSKEGKHGVLEEGKFGVQDKHGTLVGSLCLAQETAGELEEEKQMIAEGILGIQGNLGHGLQGETWISGELTPNNGCPRVPGSRIPREENMEERSRRTVGSKIIELRGKANPENLEKEIADLDDDVGPMDVEKGSFTANEIKSCKDAAFGLKSREKELQNEESLLEQTLQSSKEGLRESVLGPRGRGSTGPNRDNRSQSQGDLQAPKGKRLLEHESSGLLDGSSLGSTDVQHQSLRLAKNGTPVQEEDEPPSKRPQTESPEPGGERSRRSLGLSPNSAVVPAPNTRSGSRRPPSITPPRVERLTRARGRWQQEEEQSRVRPQRSRSRPDRSLVRTPETSSEVSIQSTRTTRSKKMEEDSAKDEEEDNAPVVSEGSELLESEGDKARTCGDKTKDPSTKAPVTEPDLAEGEQLPDTCEKEVKRECSSKDDPVVAKNAELESLVKNPFNSPEPDCHPGTTVQCLSGTTMKCVCEDLSFQDKNAGMCNSACGRIKKEEDCNGKMLPSIKNASECITNIGSPDKGSSMSETICLRLKQEEGCNTISPLADCAVKAVPLKAVKLEDHSGEPRDCEASLGIEGVEPHLPVRVSPVTPMILNMDRNSYRKISVTKKPSDPMCWTVMDVVQYFTDAGFAEQASAFKEQEIDGKSLLLMQRTDVLTGLSIRLGPALKMYEHHIKILQQCHFAEENDFLG